MKSICGLDLVCGPQLANHCLERNSWSKCVAFVCLLESSACLKVTYVMALVYFRKDLGLAYTFAWSHWHIHFWHMWISGSHQGTLHRRIIWKVPPKHSSSGPSVDQWHQAVCREPRQLQYFFKCTPGDYVYDCSWVKNQQIRAMAFKLSPSADAPIKPSCRGIHRLQVRSSGVDSQSCVFQKFPMHHCWPGGYASEPLSQRMENWSS